MADFIQIEVSNIAGSKGEVKLVRFLNSRILDMPIVREVGQELLNLAENHPGKNFLLNLANVEYLSSSAINKLIVLHQRVASASGRLMLCSLQPVIAEIFASTKLDTVFEIRPSEKDALASF